MLKNTASQKIGSQMITAADGTAFAGEVTVYVCGDAGTQALGSVGSGVCVHEGNGYHSYAPDQAETNYALIAFTFIGSGAIPATVQVFTQIAQQTGDSFGRLGAAGAGLTALGDTRIANLDATISSRLTPSGTLAVCTTNTDMRGTDNASLASVLGAAVGASISADIAAVKAQTVAIETDTDVIDDATSGLVKIATDVAAILVDTNELQTDDIPGTLATIAGYLDTEIAAIVAAVITNAAGVDIAADIIALKAETALIVADTNELQTDDYPTSIAAVKAETALIVADTNELQTDWADGGRLDVILDAAGGAGDPWITVLPGAYGAGTAGKIIGDNINAPIATVDTVVDGIVTDIAAVKAETALILADTNELQTDDYPTSIAAIKAETALIVADTNELQVDNTPAAIAALDAVVDTVKVDTAAIKVITDTLTAAAAAKLAASAGTMILGTVEAGTLSTTQATTDISLTDADQLNGRVIIFRFDTTTAGLQYQATNITDFTVAAGLLTFTAITQAPSAGDTFVIV